MFSFLPRQFSKTGAELRSSSEDLAKLIERREKARIQSIETCAAARRIVKECMSASERFRAVDAELIGLLRNTKASQATEVTSRGIARGDQKPIVSGGGLILASSNAHAPIGNGFLIKVGQKQVRFRQDST